MLRIIAVQSGPANASRPAFRGRAGDGCIRLPQRVYQNCNESLSGESYDAQGCARGGRDRHRQGVRGTSRHRRGSALSVPIQPGSTVDDLLAILDGSHRELAGALRRGLSEGYLNVLVNGRNARFLTGGATRLADGDAVAFLPPIGGG